jgi:hypothetical protein
VFGLVFVIGGEFVALEVDVEDLVVSGFFFGCFGENQAERIFENGAVLEADQVDGAGGVDALGGGDFQTGASGDLQEPA